MPPNESRPDDSAFAAAEGHSIQKKFTGQLKGDAIKC